MQIKELTLQHFGTAGSDVLEEHFAYIAQESAKGASHKAKYFRKAKIIRWLAFGSGASSGILAFWTFEATGTVLPLTVKIVLTLCSIFGPVAITLLKDSQETESNQKTWIRHTIYVNNCMNECLKFVNGVKEYAGKKEDEARMLLLENLVEHRENNDEKFEYNMNK